MLNTTTQPISTEESKSRARIVSAVAIMTLGVIALVANLAQNMAAGVLILPAVALVFAVWGAVLRLSGLFIPAGILTGLGLGVALNTTTNLEALGNERTGGIFLLCMALGWALIPILSRLFTRTTHLWALIPGGIIGALGVVLLLGPSVQDPVFFVLRLWPVALILGGAALILRRRQL